MCTITVVRWITNAAVRFSATHGAVSSQARRADCSRQAIYDQARKVHDAVEAECSPGPSREQLMREIEALRRENTELWNWVDQAIKFPEVKQQQFSAEAHSMGLSLNQIGDLLSLLLESTSVGSLRRARMFWRITPRDREPPGFRNDTGARPPQEPGGPCR